jgi:transcriptional regulator with XRE-family HTH domain
VLNLVTTDIIPHAYFNYYNNIEKYSKFLKIGVVFMEYLPDYKLIGLRIKDKRVKIKLTQEKLAEFAGVSVQHLSKIETGNTKLSLPCLIAIANALKTTVNHILMDSVYTESKAHLLKEVEAVYADCSPAETFILVETSKALKNSIRIKTPPKD